ncbi:MAG: MBL fold metallo-hydrolase [Lachnospiraceae bacterium]|nr:MBL fold metallo-hydrolase [Lachnospiraceae bacterium]
MERITYFCSEEIAEKSWKIMNVGGSTPALCYLVEGRDFALLIDSIIGIGNLKAYCETLTDKPIKVVNTHAHTDHVGGNFHFDHCFMHPRDIGFFQSCTVIKKEQVLELAKGMAPEELRENMILDDNFVDWNPIKIYPINDGDVFDLGDRQIEVVYVGGHTAGSIVLIDHKTRIAYSGDACNGNTLLEFENSLPIVSYLKNLLHLKEHQSEFDMMYGGHEIHDPSILDEAIETVAKVVAGTDDKCERTGMMGTPVYYAAEKVKDGYARVDGKHFNMSYLPSNIYGPEETKQVITGEWGKSMEGEGK